MALQQKKPTHSKLYEYNTNIFYPFGIPEGCSSIFTLKEVEFHQTLNPNRSQNKGWRSGLWMESGDIAFFKRKRTEWPVRCAGRDTMAKPHGQEKQGGGPRSPLTNSINHLVRPTLSVSPNPEVRNIRIFRHIIWNQYHFKHIVTCSVLPYTPHVQIELYNI